MTLHDAVERTDAFLDAHGCNLPAQDFVALRAVQRAAKALSKVQDQRDAVAALTALEAAE